MEGSKCYLYGVTDTPDDKHPLGKPGPLPATFPASLKALVSRCLEMLPRIGAALGSRPAPHRMGAERHQDSAPQLGCGQTGSQRLGQKTSVPPGRSSGGPRGPDPGALQCRPACLQPVRELKFLMTLFCRASPLRWAQPGGNPAEGSGSLSNPSSAQRVGDHRGTSR